MLYLMAINEWKIWKKVGITKEKEREEVKIEEDLKAVISFLKEIEVKQLIEKLEKLAERVKEGKIIKAELSEDNLKEQIKLLDEILKEYNFFEDDVDVNGLRLKKIGREFLREAKEKGIKELIKEKKRDINWKE